MSSCGCSGNQGQPPDSTPAASSLPSQAGNSYGGGTTIPNSCTPNVCPQPPVNNEVGRDPYCPDWISKVLSATFGKVLLIKGSCLHYLRSKCTGVLWYDRETEQITVKDAPFVSSIPKQTGYGFLAKVLPRRRQVCDDTTEDCRQEATQELAAQVMGLSGFGDLMVAVPPLCGELPQDEAVDADKQVAIHKLNPTDMPCSAQNIGFLVRADGSRGNGANKMLGTAWHFLKRLRMRRTQWGQALSGSTDEASSFIAVLVPVAGGTTEDPCYELRISEQKPGGGLPTNANNCDKLIFKNKGTPNAGWYAVAPGLSFYPITTPTLLFSYGGNSANIPATLPEYPTDACGDVWAIFSISGQAFAGSSGSATTVAVNIGVYPLFSVGTNGLNTSEARAKTTSSSVTFAVTTSGNGSRLINVYLIGYLK